MTTAVDLYRALNEGFDHICPSGITVKMRRLSLANYLRSGRVPNHLQACVESVQDKGLAGLQDHKDALKDFFEWTLCEALIVPLVTTRPELADADTLPIDYLPEPDKSDIFQTAFSNMAKAVETLRPFVRQTAARTSSPSTRSANATDSGQATS